MDKINNSQFNNAQASSSRQVNTPVISSHVITNSNQLLPCCKEIISRKVEIKTNFNDDYHRADWYKNDNEDFNYTYASRHGNTEYLERNLAKQPENINFYYKHEFNPYTRTLLHCAIINHQFNTVKFLIEKGASLDITPNPLILACQFQFGEDTKMVASQEIIHYLLSVGANPNYIHQDEFSCDDTPLHASIARNKISTIQLLLDHGANPNFSTVNANAKLYLKSQKLEYLRLALENGLNVHTYYDGSQLLHRACENRWEHLNITDGISIETISLLLEHGADPNAKTRRKNESATALHFLLVKKNIEQDKVKLLLKYGADPTIKGVMSDRLSIIDNNSEYASTQIRILNNSNLAYTPLELMAPDDLKYMGSRIEAWKLPPLVHSIASETNVIATPADQNATDAEATTTKKLSRRKKIFNKIRGKSNSNINSSASTSHTDSAETSNAIQSSQPQGQVDSENPPNYYDLFPNAKR